MQITVPSQPPFASPSSGLTDSLDAIEFADPVESILIDPPSVDQLQGADSNTVKTVTYSQKELQKFLARRHPEFDELSGHWEFLAETYEGGREWFKTNIFRYIKEGDDEYSDRLNRAYRFNHTREVVDLVNKYLFKKAIARKEDIPDFLKTFWSASTKAEKPIDALAKEISRMSSIYGRIGVVIDRANDADENGKTSVAEASKNQPYAYIVTPLQLLDYAKDDEGELLWVKILETYRDDTDPILCSGEIKTRYRLWEKNSWTLYEEVMEGKRKIIKIVDQGQHNLGMVPVILADNVESDEPYEAQAMIDDIAYLDRAVANYLSNLDAIIQDQTFSQLTMPAQNVLPGEESYDAMVRMGTKRVFLYDGEGGNKPEYISPDPRQAELIVTVINKIINEIYHTVGLAGERTKQDNAVGIDNSSGVAKAFDFERVNALLASKAKSLEAIENQIVEIVAAWNGQDIEEQERFVIYPDNFDIRDLYDEFDIATQLELVSAPDTLRREQMRRVVDKLFPQLKDDLRKAIESELKQWPPEPPVDAQGQTIVQKQGSGQAPTYKQKLSTTNNRQGQVTKGTDTAKA